MSTLDDYLSDQYLNDQRELENLARDIQDIGATLSNAFIPGKSWPYRLKRGAEDAPGEKPSDVSQSTTAMVALSLYKLAGDWKRPAGYAPTPLFPALRVEVTKRAQELANTATKLLIADLVSGEHCGTKSSTYGKNDPLTLFYVVGLFAVQDRPGPADAWNKIKAYVDEQCGIICEEKNLRARLADHGRFFDFRDRKKKLRPEVVSNAFIPLRVMQAIRNIRGGKKQDLPDLRAYFESRLHDQLSFSSIPDSRFDPAELVFCLEGLLLAQGTAVDRSLFRRVLDVLSTAQQMNAFWRPTKPFLATQKGMSLFPLSVEVANSLLRTCENFDSLELYDTFGSDSLGLFHRYAQWLRARTVTFDYKFSNEKGKEKVVGWHSEHVNEPDTVHLWQTSQVLEFFLGFYQLLQAHIARTTLVRSHFNTKSFVLDLSVNPPKIHEEPKPRIDNAKPPVPDSSGRWAEVQKESEPVTHLGANYEIYARLGTEFFAGWADPGKVRSFSMLLYGPPGTGKTTVAKTLAAALGFRLITITVSDFLADGGVEIEARAKAIFDVLRAQSDCVVLFDEIDNFLLDRDTKRYAEQETVFQFMTPGMLTKLADLHDAKRVIFVIATNYGNRIDPAIKRPGRIDKQYLVLPPDGGARKRTMKNEIPNGSGITQPTAEEWASLIANSVFLSFPEIKAAVSKVVRDGTEWAKLADSFSKSPRTIRLETFHNRLLDRKEKENKDVAIEENGQWPLEEFLCLLALALETHEPKFLDRHACLAAKKIMGLTNVDDAKAKVADKTIGLPPTVVDAVSKYLFYLE